MYKIRKTAALTAFYVAFSVPSGALDAFPAEAASPRAAKSSTKAEQPRDTREDDVRQVLMELANAVNEGNSEKAIAFWSADATLIDTSGELTQGLPALKERLSQNYDKQNAPELGLHPEKISFPAPTVAIVIGSASRKKGDILLPAARFSMVMAKESDKWLIKEATEIATQEASRPSVHLNEIGWLIGNWEAQRQDGGVKLQVEWAGPAHNFILSKSIRNGDKGEQIDRQIIGWDARIQSIVSWHFDCNGGFGYGKWKKKPDGWQVEFAGATAGGDDTRATNIFTINNGDEFTWQSEQKNAGGETIAESAPIKVKRTK